MLLRYKVAAFILFAEYWKSRYQNCKSKISNIFMFMKDRDLHIKSCLFKSNIEYLINVIKNIYKPDFDEEVGVVRCL